LQAKWEQENPGKPFLPTVLKVIKSLRGKTSEELKASVKKGIETAKEALKRLVNGIKTTWRKYRKL